MRDHHTNAPHLTSRPRRLTAVLAVGGALLVGGISTAAGASAAPGNPGNPGDPGVLARIKACESGGSYTAHNPSSSASGAYQFLTSTWRALPASAGYPTAASAPAAVQDRAARELFARQGSSPWLASASCWRGATGTNTQLHTQVNTRSTARSGTRSSTARLGTASSSRSNGSEWSTGGAGARGPADIDDRPDRLTRPPSASQRTDRADNLQRVAATRGDLEVSVQRTENGWHLTSSQRPSFEND